MPRNLSISRSSSNPRRIVLRKVSRPFTNPLIQAKGLNPVRTYEADVMEGNQKKEHLTGVVFANQGINDQLQHHASVRGHGLLPVRGTKHVAPFGSEYKSFQRSRRR